MIKEDCPLVPYAKTTTGESNILLYKMVKADAAIVRAIFEANGMKGKGKE